MANPKNQKEASQPKAIAQNKAPVIPWKTFEQCWNACVKNGDPLLMAACKAHLQALGWLKKPDKWIAGMQHFGLKIEK